MSPSPKRPSRDYLVNSHARCCYTRWDPIEKRIFRCINRRTVRYHCGVHQPKLAENEKGEKSPLSAAAVARSYRRRR